MVKLRLGSGLKARVLLSIFARDVAGMYLDDEIVKVLLREWCKRRNVSFWLYIRISMLISKSPHVLAQGAQ